MERFYKVDGDYAIIELSSSLYPTISVQKTSANYMEEVYIKLEEKDNCIIVKLKLTDKRHDLNKIIGEFYNDLLRETLRYNIAMETKNLRELIVGRALYTTCIEVDEDKEDIQKNEEFSISDDEDYSLDEIAVNWFLENDDIK